MRLLRWPYSWRSWMCRLAWPAEACSPVRTTYLPDAGAVFSLRYVSATLGHAPAEHDHAVQAAQVLVSLQSIATSP